MMVHGTWAERYLGWPRPKTAEQLAEEERRANEANAAEIARLQEAGRPTAERVAALTAQILAQLPGDLRADVNSKKGAVTEARERAAAGRVALAEHLAAEGEQTPQSLEQWLARKYILESSLPYLDGWVKRAQSEYDAAIETARKALRKPADDVRQASVQVLLDLEKRHRAERADADTARSIAEAASAAALGFSGD